MTKTTVIPRRSALFMPASNVRALEKAQTLPCDTVIFDLEDAVSPDAKDVARVQACEAVASGAYGARELVIRINGFDTPWGQADLAAVVAAKPAAILLPKVEGATDVLAAESQLKGTGINLWAMLETPKAFMRLDEIASAAERLTGLVIGPNDLTKGLRARRVPGRAPIMPALSMALLAGRTYGQIVLDGVYNDFRDSEGFEAECLQARDMGFDGKTLIHPNQIEVANTAFSPSNEDVQTAKELIEAFEAAQSEGKGVAVVNGQMIEELHLQEAQHLLTVSSAIMERETAEG